MVDWPQLLVYYVVAVVILEQHIQYFDNVHYIVTLPIAVISVSKLTQHKSIVIIDSNKAAVMNNNSEIIIAHLTSNKLHIAKSKC